MLRIFHVPSYLTYVAKLAGPECAPVPSPVGQPLRLGALVALDSWDFFDVLHMHTVELAAGDEIERIASRATCEDKRLVFAAHDLVPNIETGMAAFGALRPRRDLVGLARAWRTLPQPRPALRVLVRSLTKADRQRYPTVLAERADMRHTEPGFTIALTTEMLTPDVPTRQAQPVDGPHCEAAWFPPQALAQSERFTGYSSTRCRCRCHHPPPRVRRSAHVGPPSSSGPSMLTPTCVSLPF